ncbi:hypothetical protein HBI18_046530 [Parastagonospora nodorum]|nr:hypothetical protein HBH46_058270 [Parastagonospora nodorum]KAH5741377.1 hypothetical protein HBI18_046530 [Parastagonospora nodorum]
MAYNWKNKENDRVIKALLANPYWQPITRIEKEFAGDFRSTKTFESAKNKYDAERMTGQTEKSHAIASSSSAKASETSLSQTVPGSALPSRLASQAAETLLQDSKDGSSPQTSTSGKLPDTDSATPSSNNVTSLDRGVSSCARLAKLSSLPPSNNDLTLATDESDYGSEFDMTDLLVKETTDKMLTTPSILTAASNSGTKLQPRSEDKGTASGQAESESQLLTGGINQDTVISRSPVSPCAKSATTSHPGTASGHETRMGVVHLPPDDDTPPALGSDTPFDFSKLDDSTSESVLKLLEVDTGEILKTRQSAELAGQLLGLINKRLEEHKVQLSFKQQGVGVHSDKTFIDVDAPLTQTESQELAAVKRRTLEQFQEQIDDLEKEFNVMSGHLVVILRQIKRQYELSESTIPLPLMLLKHQPVPLFWDAIRCLSESGAWIDGTMIDWLLMTSEANAEVDFIPTNCALYMDTISQTWTSDKDKGKSEEALMVRLTALISTGPIDKYRIPIKAKATTLLFPWNPSGVHWVLVVAEIASNGVRNIQILDTINNAGRRHQATWRQTGVLGLFLELLGQYHHTFSGAWPKSVSPGFTVRQVDDDCGVFTVWNARHILLGQEIPDTLDAFELASLLRTSYIGSVRSAIEGSGVYVWDETQSAEYGALVQHRKASSGSGPTGSGAMGLPGSRRQTRGSEAGWPTAKGRAQNSRDGFPQRQNRLKYNGQADHDEDDETDAWLDEYDKMLKELAEAQTQTHVNLAAISGYPNGLTVYGLDMVLGRLASALHLPPFEPAFQHHRKYQDKYFIQTGADGTVLNTLTRAKDAGPIKVNPKQQFEIPQAALALFSDDRHVKDASDDINSVFNLVLPVKRVSGQVANNVTFRDMRTEAADHCLALYDKWDLVFNQLPFSHTAIQEAEEIEPGNPSPFYWTPLHLGCTTSNQTIFGKGSGRESESTRVIGIIEQIRAMVTTGTVKVLLLFVGIDSLTTDNQSWNELEEQFPNVSISLTSMNFPSFSIWYPSVYTTRLEFSWTHLLVQELSAAYRDRAPLLLPLVATQPKVARWLFFMAVLYKKKCDQQNTHRGKKPPVDPLAARLTVFRSGLFNLLMTERLAKECEVCQSQSPNYWVRGASLPEAVRCSTCPAPETDPLDCPTTVFDNQNCCAVRRCQVSGVANLGLYHGVKVCHKHMKCGDVRKCTDCKQYKYNTKWYVRNLCAKCYKLDLDKRKAMAAAKKAPQPPRSGLILRLKFPGRDTGTLSDSNDRTSTDEEDPVRKPRRASKRKAAEEDLVSGDTESGPHAKRQRARASTPPLEDEVQSESSE